MSSSSSPSPQSPETSDEKSAADAKLSAGPLAFEAEANSASPSLFREFYDFLIDYRAWWLTPIVLALLLLAGLVFLSGTAVAPLIYPLF